MARAGDGDLARKTALSAFMILYLHALVPVKGDLVWQMAERPSPEDEDIDRLAVTFTFGSWSGSRRTLIERLRALVVQENLEWIFPGERLWRLDLRRLTRFFEPAAKFTWLPAEARVEPKVLFPTSKMSPGATVEFHVNKDSRVPKEHCAPPLEIHDSLERFQYDHPDPSNAAFLMMRFDESPAQLAIHRAVNDALAAHGIKCLRADERMYHKHLFFNIATYMHGCGMGVAVFERLKQDDFNPNISLEVGFMAALDKPLCLLKDKTLRCLQSDLVGWIYRPFDTFDPVATVGKEIERWLADFRPCSSTTTTTTTTPPPFSHPHPRRFSGALFDAISQGEVLGPGANCSRCNATLAGKAESKDWFTCTGCRRDFCRQCAPGTSDICPQCAAKK